MNIEDKKTKRQNLTCNIFFFCSRFQAKNVFLCVIKAVQTVQCRWILIKMSHTLSPAGEKLLCRFSAEEENYLKSVFVRKFHKNQVTYFSYFC